MFIHLGVAYINTVSSTSSPIDDIWMKTGELTCRSPCRYRKPTLDKQWVGQYFDQGIGLTAVLLCPHRLWKCSMKTMRHVALIERDPINRWLSKQMLDDSNNSKQTNQLGNQAVLILVIESCWMRMHINGMANGQNVVSGPVASSLWSRVEISITRQLIWWTYPLILVGFFLLKS